MPRKLSLLAAALFAIAGFTASPAYADLIPTHGAVVHLDPFAPPDPPSAVPGVTGAKVLPFSSQVRLGGDGLFAPGQPWHWENEIEIDAPPLPVFWNGIFVGLAGLGTSFYMDFHQIDLGGSKAVATGLGPTCNVVVGEVGSVCKGLINLTPFDVYWGVSVTEDRDIQQEKITIKEDNVFALTYDRQRERLVIRNVPEPGSLGLLLVGSLIGGVALRRRR